MTAKTEYPLARVIDIKIRRVEEAEKLVLQRQKELEKEQEKLRQCEAERDKVKEHRQDKMNQLREELDKGTTSDKIIQMKVYIKVVEERLKLEEKKVSNQKEQVRVAEKNLEAAIEELRAKRIEVDKLKAHREGWMKEKKRELDLSEEKEMDEIGQIVHALHQRSK